MNKEIGKDLPPPPVHDKKAQGEQIEKMNRQHESNEAVDAVKTELAKIREEWPVYNSAHEGLGILLEEVRELEAHVFMKQTKRDVAAMRKEAIQIAAVACRFAIDICNEHRGRK